MLSDYGYSEKQVIAWIKTFSSLDNKNQATTEIEQFLHEKALLFSSRDICRTYLVFDEGTMHLLGYFSIAIKSWKLSDSEFEMLSTSQRKKLGVYRNNGSENLEIRGYLIGQLGLNYQNGEQDRFTGNDLLEITFEKIRTGHQIFGGKITWLECYDYQALHRFYLSNNFSRISRADPHNNLQMYFRQTKNL